MSSKKSKTIKYLGEALFILVLLAAIVFIYLQVASECSEILQMSKTKDYTAVKEYLQSFEWKGGLIIAILEMLQMIVIFIPAEFVQIAAGLAYPVYYALPICLAGICLGATVIFLIVRILHLRLSIMERKTGKIQKVISRINSSAPMTVIMYLLFIMPMIPFGAICYFAASSNISYKRYILVVSTAVIPSVLSSYVLGNVMYQCIGLGGATFVLVVIGVIIAMAALLLTIAWIIKKNFATEKIKKPNAIWYAVLMFFSKIFFALKFKTDLSNCEKIQDESYVCIGTHTSFADFYFTARANRGKRINVVTNRYYTQSKSTRFLVNSLNTIPKSLFAPDIETVKKMLEAKKQGCVIDMRPEGRLSTDGSGFPPAPGTASLIKKLGLAVYFNKNVGGYFAKPKWRAKFGRNTIYVSMKRLLTAEQVAQMTVEQIQEILLEQFKYDECEAYKTVTPKKNSVDVRGLEGILYRCPDCGAEGEFCSTKTTLTCNKCGKVLTFNDNYLADGKTISQMFNEQKAFLGDPTEFSDSQFCTVKRMNLKKGEMQDCGSGTCTLSNGVITFQGEIDGEQKTFSHNLQTLFALAFGVGEEFEFYYDKVLYYFYPQDRLKVIKWSVVWDMLQERIANEKDKESC